MNKLKLSFISTIIVLTITFLSFNATYAFFSSNAASNNNVFATAQTFPTATPIPTPTPIIAQTLVINEILPSSTCSSGQTEGQFVELWNGTNATVNLKDFKLSDGSTTIAVSNSNSNLASHAFAILVKSNGVINTCLGDVHSAITPNLGGQVNMNTGTMQLLDSTDVVIDTVKWGSNPNPQPTTNQSIERNPTGHDSVTGTNFEPSDFVVRPTPRPGQ